VLRRSAGEGRAQTRRRAVRLAGVGALVLAGVTAATATSGATTPATPTTPLASAVGVGTAADVGPPPNAPQTAPATAPSTAPPAATATAAAAAQARRPGAAVLDALPPGAPPVMVPYAIGTRVYYRGRMTDLADRFADAYPGSTPTPGQRQLAAVTGAGGFAWTQFTGVGVDVVHVVGRVSPAGGYTPFHASTGRVSTLAVTTSGLVAMPESGEAYAPGGAFTAAFTGSPNIDCGSCAPTAAGPRVVLDQWTGPAGLPEHQATWLWYPPAAIQRLDDRVRAVGRLGSGALGLRQEDGCWRLAPATAPDRLGPAICSLTTPLVDTGGRLAVVVQGGRLRVVDPRTGATVSSGTMGPVDGWSPATRYAVPAAWETADAYLVTVRLDDALGLVRCSAATGACTRAVRAAVRPGVDRIVTERGASDAVPVP